MELVKVDNLLISPDGAMSWAVIKGAPGIGKSELALQYAFRYADRFPGGVFWLDAKSELSKQWRQRALSVELDPRDLDPDVVEREVLRRISNRPPLLVVLDNAERWDRLESQLPRGVGHSFLATSRERSFGGHQFQDRDVMLKPLEVDSAGDLVRTIMGERGRRHPEDVAAVVKALDGHPQELEFAAGYLARRKSVTVERFFLERLERVGKPDGIRHPQGYPEMMEQILQDVSSKQQGALRLFCLTGLYADAPSRLFLLKETWAYLREKAKFEDAWDALVDAYLVKEVQEEAEETWTMLPILREKARRQEGITDDLRAAHSATLRAYLERLEESGEGIPLNVLAHVEFLEAQSSDREKEPEGFQMIVMNPSSDPPEDLNQVAAPVYRLALSVISCLLLMVVL